LGVSKLVRVDFRDPPRTICLRRGSMMRATVPETAVDEHGDFPGDKRDVY
jgi:hypothetical protein